MTEERAVTLEATAIAAASRLQRVRSAGRYEVYRLEADVEPGVYLAMHRAIPIAVPVERVRQGIEKLTRGLDSWHGLPPLDDPGWRLIGRSGPFVGADAAPYAMSYLLAVAPIVAAAVRCVAFDD